MKFNFLVSPTGLGRGCQCAEGTQDTVPVPTKKQKENFIQFSEVPTHVISMNDFSEALT